MCDYGRLKFRPQRHLGLCQPNTDYTHSIATPHEQRERKSSLAAAIALRWDDSRVTVVCQFCFKTHNHGILHFDTDEQGCFKLGERGQYTYHGPSPMRSESRRAHCNHDAKMNLEYTILFPFEDDPRVKNLSFEIRRSTQNSGEHIECFHTVGLDHMDGLNPPESDDDGSVLIGLQNINISDVDSEDSEASLGETITYRESDLLISYAVMGNLQEMRKLLGNKLNAGNFTKIKDGYGSSLLALAVESGHIDVVRYLINLGADVNSRDIDGRTPLMEAALGTQDEIADLLLEMGANNALKDSNRMLAANSTNDSDRNDKTSHTRALKCHEDPITEKRHRRFIKPLLQSPSVPRNRTGVISVDRLGDAYFYKSSNSMDTTDTISFSILTKDIMKDITIDVKTTTEKQTAALLIRHHAFPTVAATSGWTSPGSSEFTAPEAGCEKLDSAYWVSAGLIITKHIGFKFEEHSYDRAHAKPFGSYYACHAEAQLMSFLISRNYLLRDYHEGETVTDDLLQLFLLQERSQSAHIIVSKEPCPSCRLYAKHIKKTLGIKFHLIHPKANREKKPSTRYQENGANFAVELP